MSEGLDLHSSNPFLPSLMMIAEGAQGTKVRSREGKRRGAGEAVCLTAWTCTAQIRSRRADDDCWGGAGGQGRGKG